jgi:O-antigen/teichoic acid export membrane protein
LSFFHKIREIVFLYIYCSIIPAECLGVLAGTLGLLGVLWYTGRRRYKYKNPISKKRCNRELLKEDTLIN